MNERTATMAVTIVAADAVAIGIAGDVTAACEPDLVRAHERATKSGARRIVLDFAAMDYMNSGGIGLLVTMLVRGGRKQQRFAAVGLSEHYRQIFELTRLDEAIALHDTVESALSALAGAAR